MNKRIYTLLSALCVLASMFAMGPSGPRMAVAQRVTEVRVRYDNGAEEVFQASHPAEQFAEAPNPPTTPSPGSPHTKPLAIRPAIRLIPGKYAGDAWHVDGTSSDLAGHNPIDVKWQWDFGDPGSDHNQLTGFNAAHIYGKAGDYTITLALTDTGGTTSTTTASAHVLPDQRMVIHVAANGDDQANGTVDHPIRSVARAAQRLRAETVIAFRRGDQFTMDTNWNINQPNVRITAYGTGDKPYLAWGKGSWNLNAHNIVVENLTIDAADKDAVAKGGGPTAFMLRGVSNLVIRNCTFPYVFQVANGNGKPDGVLMIGNDCPNVDGLNKYFCWTEGSCYTLLENYVANSVQEHCVRMTRAARINLQFNNFANLDRRNVAPGDYSKTTITAQIASYVWIANNKLADGPTRCGPLVNAGQATADNIGDRCRYCVIENNTVSNTTLGAGAGSDGVLIRDNIITIRDDFGISIAGYNDEYKKGVTDCKVIGNKVISNSPYGGLIRYDGPARELVLQDNTFVDPNFVAGAYQSANVYVGMSDLSAFTSIRNNTWQKPIKNTWTGDGAAFYVWPTWSDRRGYWTIEKWLAQPQVSGDKFAAGR